MAKIGIGESKFEAGGETYTLRFDICVMMELEGVYDASIDRVMEILRTGQARHAVRVFHEMLKGGGHDISLQDAAHLFATDIDAAGKAVSKCLEGSTDTGERKARRAAKK